MKLALPVAGLMLVLVGCEAARLPVERATTTAATAAPGPAGAPGRDGASGMDGVSVKTTLLAVGDATCPFGGARFIAAEGESYACHGDPGLQRVYGTGGAGDKIVTGHEDWSNASAAQLQFQSLIIETGAVVEVASGTVLRSRGPVVVRGTLRVRPGVRGPELLVRPAPGSYLAVPTMAGAGIASVPAFAGDLGDATFARSGGRGGISGIEPAAVRTLVRAGTFGGGAGAASFGAGGCAGGGSLVIVSEGELVLDADGRILATGESCRSGGGGGGGGVVVLASRASLTVHGEVSARGGNGGTNTVVTGAGGGGGGGLVHAIAPTLTLSRDMNVDGGAAGGTGTAVTLHARSGGGGGGASAGNGGAGGNVSGQQDATPNFAQAAQPGAIGMVVLTETDPATLF